MKLRIRTAAAALLVPLLLQSPARADQAWENADIVCSSRSELAVVRFGMSWNNDPPQYAKLPASVDQGLSAALPSKDRTCRLPSGRVVSVRMWGPEPQDHGVGGGDPQSYFDLWVGSRQVRAKQQWKPRGYVDEPWISAVVVKSDRLIVCTRPSEDDETTCATPEPLTAHSDNNSNFNFECDLNQKAARVTTENGILVYRYGSADNVELTIREEPSSPNVFYRHDTLGSKGEGQQLRFVNGRYSYVLSSWFVAGAGGSEGVKFFVMQGDKVLLTRLCRMAPSFTDYHQFDHLPQDAMKPLGY